jgi:hypothetical protein
MPSEGIQGQIDRLLDQAGDSLMGRGRGAYSGRSGRIKLTALDRTAQTRVNPTSC